MNPLHLLRHRSSRFLAILLLGLAFTVSPSRAAEPPKLTPAVQAFIDDHQIAGAVLLVADANKILDTEATGWMDIAGKKQMRTDCLFWIASMTKPITCTALMMLVDEGKIDVDAPVARYLPEFADQMLIVERDDNHVLLKKPTRPMLVRDLMSHTSGITTKGNLAGASNGEDMPLATRVAAYATQPLESEPGTKYRYTNVGMNTVGRLVEKVSGMSYGDFLQKRIFDPLGMTDTTFWPTDEQAARIPTGYGPDKDHTDLEPTPLSSFRHPLSDRTRAPFPAGGLFSSARDLAKFCQMILNHGTLDGHKYLSPESVEQMTSRQTAKDILEGYGFGWSVGGGKISHAGAWKTNMTIHPKEGLITIFLIQNSGWRVDEEGRKIEPAFRNKALEVFAGNTGSAVPADPHLVIGTPGETKPAPTTPPLLKPATQENFVVYQEAGRYGGWPANHGLWQWGDELVGGFDATWYKQTTTDHRIDRTKPIYAWQARSLDGGRTWKTESELPFADATQEAKPTPLTEPLDFTAPDSTLMFRFGSLHDGPSWFYTSPDRCKTWRGPYSFSVEGLDRICTRTDLIVIGPRDCLMFGSCAKLNDGKEGRPFCARTTDGGLTWKLIARIGDEPAPGGYAIMPSSLRLKSGAIITTIRRSDPNVSGFIECWRSDDLGATWTLLGQAANHLGGNPPALVQLQDGRLALTYGHRHQPAGMRARISADEGRTWSDEILVRDGAFDGDMGYPRSIVRPDGRVMTVYYFNGPRDEDRAIEGTLWTAPTPASLATASATPASAPTPLAAAPATPGPAPAWPAIVAHVRFYPAKDREAAMIGGRITGSNISAFEGFQKLAEITIQPKSDDWTELSFPNQTPYRWVRYEAPPGSHGNVAEIEFYAGARKLGGAFYGSPGYLAPGAHWKAALDAKPETFFNSNNADGQFVGIDLGDFATAARPAIVPGEGNYDQPQLVKLLSRTPGTTIRYTLDGTVPNDTEGQLYTTPFLVDKNAAITAVSFKEGLPPSPASTATLWIDKPTQPPLRSFHIGNSLTNNAGRFTSFFRTAGGTDAFPKFIIGGATTQTLWNGKGGVAKESWEKAWAAAQHPLDYFTLQPRDFEIAREADYCNRFLKVVREKSPDVQPWLYAEWDEMARERPTDKGLVPSSEMTKTFPALTWQESMSAMVLYDEEVQRAIVALDPSGKRPRILPTALALGWARTLVDRGEMPGVRPGEAGFYSMLFEDHVHVNASGCYLVDLTWYGALVRESPEGKMLPLGASLTAPQSHMLEHLAWSVIKNYPDCGLYEEGSQPCAKPEFANDGKVITLKSATPGAWFRYTLDGTTPTRTNGYIYCGVISVQPGIAPKAIAFKSGMADSEVTSLEMAQP